LKDIIKRRISKRN